VCCDTVMADARPILGDAVGCCSVHPATCCPTPDGALFTPDVALSHPCLPSPLLPHQTSLPRRPCCPPLPPPPPQVIPSLEMLSVVRAAVDAWSSLTHHPGLLVPQEGFVASELDGSPSLVVTTSYVPGAVTLAQAHLQPTQVGRAREGGWGWGIGLAVYGVWSGVFSSCAWCRGLRRPF
jgi:hypothetical protein